MSQQIFKFIAALPSISPVYNSILVAGDTLLNAFAKLQGLLQVKQIRHIITSSSTGCANTTADFNFSTVTVPANSLQAGSLFILDYTLDLDKDNTNSNFLFWIKDNSGNKIITLTVLTTNRTTANKAIRLHGMITIRAIGPTGSLIAELDCLNNFNNITAAINVTNLSSPVSFNSTVSNTFTIGANTTVADTNSSLTVLGGGIWLT